MSVSAAIPNPDQVSAFAATRASDGALTIVVVNKNLVSAGASTSVTIDLSNFAHTGVAQQWRARGDQPGQPDEGRDHAPGRRDVLGEQLHDHVAEPERRDVRARPGQAAAGVPDRGDGNGRSGR